MAALFADVNFISALFVSVADVHAVDFATVRFKRTPLCKGSVALATCVRFHTCVNSCVTLQVKGVVKTFATKCTKVSFDVTVTLQMAV